MTTTVYVVAILAVACPGGFLGRFIPRPLRPVLCNERREYIVYDPARRREAEERVQKAGPGATLEACRPGRGCEQLDEWTTIVTFKALRR